MRSDDNAQILRTGFGYDVHRLVEGRALILGGVTIPYEKGLLGHSDADVLLHALMDALLGAAALGDIGLHFPDNDDRYLGISSLELLKETGRLIKEGGFSNLRGLLYFTDGMGIYPTKRPDYEVAFILLEEPPLSVKMPPWAIRIMPELPWKKQHDSLDEFWQEEILQELPEL